MTLSAELCARAVIAAARVYGDDPVRACTAGRGRPRRALSPAIMALSGVLRLPLKRVAAAFGMRPDNVARVATSPLFREAQCAAEGVVMAWSEPLDAGVELPPPPVAVRAPEPERRPAAPPPIRGNLALAPALTARRVQREVVAILGEDPSTAPELAVRVGVGEAAVRAALSALAEEGRVRGEALTAEGWRAQTWRLAGDGHEG